MDTIERIMKTEKLDHPAIVTRWETGGKTSRETHLSSSEAVLGAVSAAERWTGSDIAARVNLPCPEVVKILLSLEKAGAIYQLNGYWMLKSQPGTCSIPDSWRKSLR
ncbi:hypothetical protein ABFV38_18440 [Enterobacter cloacae complex sp. Mu1197]|uniref:MarR family transcriptional regulator n=1 Tax=Enterobacter cloacae complex sp. Mu1197 TaxID=3152302 RepID=A0AAU7FVI8_9ENTR